MATLLDLGIYSVEGTNGAIGVGWTLSTYQAGTSTPLVTYADEALSISNGAVLTSDAGGRFPTAWLKPQDYKLILKDDAGVTKRTLDGVHGASALDSLAYNVKTFGAVGNGIADDTVAIQAAITAIKALQNGALFFPDGTYKITASLTYTGDPGEAITLFANTRPSRGLKGACIKWAGAAGGDMLQLTTGNNVYLNSLAFNANSLAKRCVFALPPSSSGIAIQDCIFADYTGAGSAGVQLGNSNFQVSEVSFLRCEFQAPSGIYGILTSTANVKNFSVDTCKFSGMSYGISWGSPTLGGSSGTMVVKFGTSNTTVADYYMACGGGTMTVIGTEHEGSARFLEGPGAVAGPCTFTAIGVDWEAGIPPADDYVISNFPGKLTLEGCQFENARIPGVTLPKINVTNPYSGTPASSITSIGCHYMNAVDRAPLYGSGNWVLDPLDGPLNEFNAKVTSIGDSGGTNAAPTRLQDCFSQIANASVGVSTYQQTAGLTTLSGQITRSLAKVTVSSTAFIAASTSQTISLGTVSTNSKIVGVYGNVTQAYAGLAGTITMKLGVTSGGNELLLAKDVKTAVTKIGLTDAELGAAISRANAVQEGYLPWAGSYLLYATLTSGTGNIGTGAATNLSAGSTTFYVVTENLQ